MSALTCRSISPHLLRIKVFRIVRKIEKTNSNWANFTSKNGRGFESRLGFSLFHLTEYAIIKFMLSAQWKFLLGDGVSKSEKQL